MLQQEVEEETTEGCCMLASLQIHACTAHGHLPREGTADAGWTLLHQLTIKTTPQTCSQASRFWSTFLQMRFYSQMTLGCAN